MTARFTDSDITCEPSDRRPDEFHVKVKGVVRFVGSRESASIVYHNLIAGTFGGQRDAQDRSLRRAIARTQ